MRLKELQFELPSELIAQRPAEPRDASRLLVLERSTGKIEHHTFRDIRQYVRSGDCMVLNNTRVIPARFFCRRATGGKIEGLFLHQIGDVWRILLKPASRLRVGERLICTNGDYELVLCQRHERGEWDVRPQPAVEPLDLLGRVGQTPLPPYIHRPDKPDADDEQRYQTVYARRAGAAAAPTAGLHFTPELLEELRAAGVSTAMLTLHVGLGTFAPISVDDLTQHNMHAEYYRIDERTIAKLNATRAAGGRIVAVGTTSVRVLESLEFELGSGEVAERLHSGWTDLFIYPPYRYRNVDRLLTNFHLPGATLLALVMAFAGIEPIRAAYAAAIEERYRFYSYGDAMLIL
ncbi:MAG: tRNA preQ1(34) S-adenosylmethionine ribosyltransferase-isomerase QueA [Planctomycetes bacterium]|nr:tRNA preQ1(34) S-adenosylmethionine ribosyltransferase-isomerase QueA [Planctomycetota bacterium]